MSDGVMCSFLRQLPPSDGNLIPKLKVRDSTDFSWLRPLLIDCTVESLEGELKGDQEVEE